MSNYVACCCLVDTASPAGLGSPAALGITEVTSVAIGLISQSNLSRHGVVRRDKALKHSELPGVSPYLWMGNIEMHFFLFSVISSLANFLGFLGTPVKFVNHFAAIAFLSCVSEASARHPCSCYLGKFPWPRSNSALPFHHARARDSLIHFSAVLSSGSSCPKPNTHVVIISTPLTLTEHTYRVSDL